MHICEPLLRVFTSGFIKLYVFDDCVVYVSSHQVSENDVCLCLYISFQKTIYVCVYT